jgi:hypothetical protein
VGLLLREVPEAAAARLRADESPELDVMENASTALRVIMARG